MKTKSPLIPREDSGYRGRFAPSPSGPLHFGSLVAAVGGYLQAKSQNGKWLLRIDDIDPPRQDVNAVDEILTCLETHHLLWDEEVFYQSQQAHVYDSVLDWLQDAGLCYYCQCTRKQILAAGGVYSGHCRDLGLKLECLDVPMEGNGHLPYSLRFKNHARDLSFHDELMGDIHFPDAVAGEDFIVKRKDGLFAYHLASVVDDIQLGITEVVRGADLLFPSACQFALYEVLGAKPPKMLHLPVAVFDAGKKLSKQGHARALDQKMASLNLYLALAFLGMPIPESFRYEKPETILEWGAEHWDLGVLYRQKERVMADFLKSVQCNDFSY